MTSSKLATWLTIAAGAIAVYYFVRNASGGCDCSSSSSLASTTPYKDWQ